MSVTVSSTQAGWLTLAGAAIGATAGSGTGIGPVGGATVGVGAVNFAKKHPILSTIAASGTVVYLNSTVHLARDLSFNLEKVEPFFNEHPADYNEVANYVINALTKPANEKDYDRYYKLAEVMGLKNIPPYVSTAKNDSGILVNPRLPSNSDDGILEHPSNQNNYSNIIYTPEGKAFDTSTEFPNTPIKSWEDYLLFKRQSQILADNMEADIINTYGVRPKGYAAHHIVPWDDNRYNVCQDLRDLLNNSGIDINESINGVYLPTRKATKNGYEAYHPEIHTEEYYNNVYDQLKKYDGDNQGMKDKLIEIGKQLKNNQFKYK